MNTVHLFRKQFCNQLDVVVFSNYANLSVSKTTVQPFGCVSSYAQAECCGVPCWLRKPLKACFVVGCGGGGGVHGVGGFTYTGVMKTLTVLCGVTYV